MQLKEFLYSDSRGLILELVVESQIANLISGRMVKDFRSVELKKLFFYHQDLVENQVLSIIYALAFLTQEKCAASACAFAYTQRGCRGTTSRQCY